MNKLFKRIFMIALVVLFIGINGNIIPTNLIKSGPVDSYQNFTDVDFVTD